MKKFACFALLALALQSVKAQVIEPNVARAQPLPMNRNFRKAGFVLLGAGAVTTALGYLYATAEAYDSFWGGTPKPKSGGTVITAGLVMLVGSIPMFIIDSEKRRARLSLNNQTTGLLPQQGRWVYQSSSQVQLTFTQVIF